MSTIVCLSDLHGNLPEVPKCDLLVIAGDLSHGFHMSPEQQDDFLRTAFTRWVIEAPANEVVIVAGNHDRNIEKGGWGGPEGLKAHYLQDKGVETRSGLKIWGTPWQPWFFGWAFNAPRFDGEKFLKEKFDKIPNDTDIIVCHGPPLGYGDDAVTPGQPGKGSMALTDAILRVDPELVVCGHIHPGYGQYRLNDTIVVNAALVDDDYQPVNKPIVIEL